MAATSTTTTRSSSSSSRSTKSVVYGTLSVVYVAFMVNVLIQILSKSMDIRMHAIHSYGRIIHEFDPYFNFRATEYLWEHGWKEFCQWFDYKVWYPLGRPVGTTIYPGMQITAVLVKQYILPEWSLNDVCCFIPVWFGALATLCTALLTYECSIGIVRPSHVVVVVGHNNRPKQQGDNKTILLLQHYEPQEFGSILSHIPIVNVVYKALVCPVTQWLHKQWNKRVLGSSSSSSDPIMNASFTTRLTSPALECGLFAAALMSVVPAHIMRSVGGGFDNECVATTAMTLTFYVWTRTLRGSDDNGKSALLWGTLTGVAYFYMVLSWGGYVFVINLIGVHAAVLCALGRFTTKLHRGYTAFYLVGTALAIQVPVVGWTPLRSLEQLGPCAVFLGFQLLEYCEIIKRRQKLSPKQTWILRFQVAGGALVVAALLGYAFVPRTYFGPISSRVRGLFVEHTKTGNPLVDSVAEHQPASEQAYFQYLLNIVFIAPVGLVMVALLYFHDASSFLLVYGAAAYFFSHRMVRLILLTAPIGSALGGVALGHVWSWALTSIFPYGEFATLRLGLGDILSSFHSPTDETPTDTNSSAAQTKKTGKNTKKKDAKTVIAAGGGAVNQFSPILVVLRLVHLGIAMYGILLVRPYVPEFLEKAEEVAIQMSHPTILFKGTTRDGKEVTVDDYREAYWWLRDNTPEDARIMAWWDYGYQITAIANRTTIADGNTWNHEHIALLGRALTSPEKEGHRIARHLADYVLVWAGGGGDDVAKSPHLARIANSVYRFICPGDPTCRIFGYDNQGQPTRKMSDSLLYKLHGHAITPGVQADKNRFQHVYTSKHGKVRIFRILSVSKESKNWVADPNNRICDAPGSWYCKGQYPPALQKVLHEKQDFAQLEDFNRDGGSDEEYQRQYMENIKGKNKVVVNPERKPAKPSLKKLSAKEIIKINENWQDNEDTTLMWELISSNRKNDLLALLSERPELAYIRSNDGRGPMWWAHEYDRQKIIRMLKHVGVSEVDHLDGDGLSPLDMPDDDED